MIKLIEDFKLEIIKKCDVYKNYHEFNFSIILDIVSPIPKAKDWREVYLKPLMNTLQELEPLESLNPINQIVNLLYDFTVNRTQARTKEDILNKSSWTDDGFTYFRMDDFFAFCKRNNWELDKIKTGNLIKQLKDIFVEETRMTLKNQTPRLVKI